MTENHFQTRAKQTLKQPLLSALQTKIVSNMYVTHSTNLTRLGFSALLLVKSTNYEVSHYLIVSTIPPPAKIIFLSAPCSQTSSI